MAQGQIELGLDVARASAQLFKIEQLMIEQMRWDDLSERGQHRSTHVRNFLLEFGDQAHDARALQICLRAAEVAGNDRKLHLRGELSDVAFTTVRERADDGVAAIV